MRFSDREVYLNVAGGLRISEPAADLAVAAALVSALTDQPVDGQTVIFGELGLSGEIRPAARADLRLKEAAKLGFKSALVPEGTEHQSLTLQPVSQIAEMMAMFSPPLPYAAA